MNVSDNKLDTLINSHGLPDALIDNYSLEYGYAIWGFDNSYSIRTFSFLTFSC